MDVYLLAGEVGVFDSLFLGVSKVSLDIHGLDVDEKE